MKEYLLLFLTVLLIVCAAILVISRLQHKKLKGSAFTDSLTGGLTEKGFQLQVRKIIESKAGSFAFVSMQLENMQSICRAFGVEEGERAMIHIHDVLYGQLGSEEPLTRTGEDSFCFVLKNRKPEEICTRLNRIHDTVNRAAKDAGDDAMHLELDCGIYLPGAKERDIQSMQSKALQARMDGEVGRYHFYDGESRDKSAWEREMIGSMDSALKTNEFVVYYQPRVRTLDQKVAGAEALIRWRHPQRGLLSPDMFLPLAAQYRKSSRIDSFVFEEVCRALARWKKQGRELCTISINISGASLDHPNFVDECYEVCSRYEVESSNIEFEMKESLLLEDMERAKSVIERFHALGFRCAVDNFGSGRTSMQLLGDLDIDTMKLDRSFFSGDNNNRRGRYIVEALLKLATQLHIRTVAEGIDSTGQVQYLQQVACDMIQGFYFFKPMPLEKFEGEVYAKSGLKYALNAAGASSEQPRAKLSAIGGTGKSSSSIILFSYLPKEDTVEFSDIFSPVLGSQKHFSDALALFRTTELIHENDREDFFRLLERCRREDGWVENTLRFYLAEGRYGWLELRLHQDDHEGNGAISGTMVNLAEWKNEVDRWKEKATRDALTGLYNREYFEQNVKSQLEQKLHTSAAILFIDVDDFKRVNDTLGHMFGDDVLCYVAKQLLGIFRHTDIVARYGGDEFVVFAPSIRREILEERLKKLCGAFKFPYRNESIEYKVSGSVGAAMFPRDGGDYEALLEHADCALYEAKSRGKDQYVLYEPYMKGSAAGEKE